MESATEIPPFPAHNSALFIEEKFGLLPRSELSLILDKEIMGRLESSHAAGEQVAAKDSGWRERAAAANRFLGLVVDHDESKGVDDPAVAALRRAKGFFESARYYEAFAPCQEAISLHPDWYEPHCIQGLLYRAVGGRASAIASFKRSLDLAPADQPGRWLLYLWIAELFSELGLSDEALSACDQADALHPDPEGIKSLADIRLGRKRRIVPKSRIADAYHNVGCALGRTGQIAAALPLLRKAYVLAPTAKMRRYAAFALGYFAEDDGCEDEKHVFESKNQGYTEESSPSQADDKSQLGMGDDDLNTEVKKARTEVVRRGRDNLTAAVKKARSQVVQRATTAAYKAMLKHIDLLNPQLSESERLTRARRLVRTYERLRKRNPSFEDHNKQLLAAFSIINKVKYQRRQAAKAAQKATLAM